MSLAEGGPKILEEEGVSPVVLLLLLLCADEDIERESLPELKRCQPKTASRSSGVRD